MSFYGFKNSNGCPVCHSVNKSCRAHNNYKMILCRGVVLGSEVAGFKYKKPTSNGIWGIYLPESEDRDLTQLSPAQIEKYERDKIKAKVEVELKKIELLKKIISDENRIKANEKLLSQLELNSEHKEDLLRRGLTEEEIKEAGFKSIAHGQPVKGMPANFTGLDSSGTRVKGTTGYLTPLRNVEGSIIGFQVRNDDATQGRYKWVGSDKNGNSSRIKNGEMPLHVSIPKEEISNSYLSVELNASPKTYDKTVVLLTEGVTKTIIASKKLNIAAIGSPGGLFASSPKTFEKTLSQLDAINHDEEVRLLVAVDAGDVINSNVMQRYKTLNHYAEKLGRKISFMYWGQVTKDHCDIDEIEDIKKAKIKYLPFNELLRISNHAIERKQRRETLEVLSSLTFPHVTFNQQYVSDYFRDKIQPETFTVIDSGMGTGKSYMAREAAVKHLMTTDYKVISLTHRNNIIRQQNNNVNEELIQLKSSIRMKMAIDIGDAESINNERAISCCYDSLPKLYKKSFKGALVILDEVENGFNHLSASTTLRDDRGNITQHFKECIQYCLETGGTVIGLEANVTDIATTYITNVLNIPSEKVKVYVNEYSNVSWVVKIGGGSFTGIYSKVEKQLEEGKRIAIATDSQSKGEQMHEDLKKKFPNKKGIRIDSKTIHLKEVKDFCEDPNYAIKTEKYDYIIYSPSLESGVDISIKGHFDIVFGVFMTLATRSQMQLLGRVRDNVPREIYVVDHCGGDLTNRSYDPTLIKEDMFINVDRASEILAIAKIRAEYQQRKFVWTTEGEELRLATDDEFAAIINLHCMFMARENLAKSDMGQNLINALKAAGHNVTLTQFEKDNEIKERMKVVKEYIVESESTDWMLADEFKYTVKEAGHVLQSHTASLKERTAAQKTIFLDNYPEIEVTPQFVKECVIRNKGEFTRKSRLRWLAMNPEEAIRREIRQYEHQYSKCFPCVYDIKHYGQISALFNQIGLMELLEQEDREFRNSDLDVIAFKKKAVKIASHIKRLLGLSINSFMSAVKILSKLLEKLGVKLTSRKEGKRGEKPTYVYTVDRGELWGYQQQLLKAMDLKHSLRDTSNESPEDLVAVTSYKTNHNSQRPTLKATYQSTAKPHSEEHWHSEDGLETIRGAYSRLEWSTQFWTLTAKGYPLEAVKSALGANHPGYLCLAS